MLLIEPLAVIDIYCCGTSHVEEVLGDSGTFRMTFFTGMVDPVTRVACRVIVARLVMSRDNIMRSRMMVEAAMGRTLLAH